ncbi:DUF4396 domain-containing protein [uncultured Thalassospira sp.]|jgi:hypothetical protein|uniref:DUF4396 domain-containing protein n=1 Tax=uncultured Thalassospira sp. TaxID=404382 RepID=UPI0030DC3D5D|tara:strand:+ start:1728 stop:2462 length:735 start_codon:yes stop_codon:yes gene_type:complete
MSPDWLHAVAIISLLMGLVSAIIIIVAEMHDPQHMWIMNAVWPLFALFASVAALWLYFRYGVLASHGAMMPAMKNNKTPPNKRFTPFGIMVAKGTAHCGSGCALGDIIAEWLVFFVPAIAIWLGYPSFFSEKMYATWILDFILAFGFGVVFQYFTIKPMRDLSFGQGIYQAIKADALSLIAWQVGMYGFMAIAHFIIFKNLLGTDLKVASVEFWFMMQIAMWCGFATSYPVNSWLIKSGVKEKM